MPKYTIPTLIEGFKRDLEVYLSSQRELLQLKVADKASRVASKSIYGLSFAVVTGFAIAQLLLTGLFALSLCFVSSPEAFEILRAITLGSLIILGVTLLLWIICLLAKKSFQHKIEAAVIDSVLENLEEQEQKEKDVDRLDQFYDQLTDPYQTPDPWYHQTEKEQEL